MTNRRRENLDDNTLSDKAKDQKTKSQPSSKPAQTISGWSEETSFTPQNPSIRYIPPSLSYSY